MWYKYETYTMMYQQKNPQNISLFPYLWPTRYLIFLIERNFFSLFRSSDASMKRSRSSLHDSEFDDEKRRTYLVKYAEGDAFGSDGQNDDQPNFSTAV
jgi:hypothetical protein